jgi:hypothetical protein
MSCREKNIGIINRSSAISQDKKIFHEVLDVETKLVPRPKKFILQRTRVLTLFEINYVFL